MFTSHPHVVAKTEGYPIRSETADDPTSPPPKITYSPTRPLWEMSDGLSSHILPRRPSSK